MAIWSLRPPLSQLRCNAHVAKSLLYELPALEVEWTATNARVAWRLQHNMSQYVSKQMCSFENGAIIHATGGKPIFGRI